MSKGFHEKSLYLCNVCSVMGFGKPLQASALHLSWCWRQQALAVQPEYQTWMERSKQMMDAYQCQRLFSMNGIQPESVAFMSNAFVWSERMLKFYKELEREGLVSKVQPDSLQMKKSEKTTLGRQLAETIQKWELGPRLKRNLALAMDDLQHHQAQRNPHTPCLTCSMCCPRTSSKVESQKLDF